MENQTVITVEALINAPEDTVWALWTNPEDIKHFDFADYRFSEDASSRDEWIFRATAA